jgi:hypothetical protein
MPSRRLRLVGEVGAKEAVRGIIADGDLAGSVLPRVGRPKRWVAIGLALQTVGIGVPGGYLISTAHREGIGGHITAATVRLAWRSDAHTTTGLVLLLVGLVVFGLGSMVMARSGGWNARIGVVRIADCTCCGLW